MPSSQLKLPWSEFADSVTDDSSSPLVADGNIDAACERLPQSDLPPSDSPQSDLPQSDRPHSELFDDFVQELLRDGNAIRFQARGGSMSPAIRDGEIVHVKSAIPAKLRKGDMVLVKSEMGFRLHRLVAADLAQDVFITRGDCGQEDDPAVSGREILGIATYKEVQIAKRIARARLHGLSGRLLCGIARGQRILQRLLA
jgi:hypothetical protein